MYTADICPYAHPQAHCPLDADGLVTVCVDYVKGKCARETCKYFHPPDHLVAQLKAVKAQSAAAAAQVLSAANAFQYSSSPIQFMQPLTLNNSQSILTAPPTTYLYPQQTSIASASSSPLVCFCIPLLALILLTFLLFINNQFYNYILNYLFFF